EGPQNRLFALGTVDLRGTDGQVVGSVLAQPKRLALLAYLATASPRGLHRRDRLVALFWPEFEQDQARHALRLALYHLRRALRPDTMENVGDDSIRLNTSMFWCDVDAFEQALDVNDTAGALALYRGDLLDGLYLSQSAGGFEQWLEGERARLRRRAAQAAGSLATSHHNEGDTTGAISWARQVSTFLPDDEPSL